MPADKQSVNNAEYVLKLLENGNISLESATTGAFDDDYAKPLQDINLFMKAKADHHTVMWTDEIDVCPEYLYENSVKV